MRHLAQGLTDENEYARANTAETLGIVGEAAPELIADTAIVDSLVARAEGDDEYPEAQGHAARALGRIATADPSLIDDRTVDRLEAVAASDDGIAGTVETVVDTIETARAVGGSGTDDPTVFCPACGAELAADPEPNFCRECGREV